MGNIAAGHGNTGCGSHDELDAVQLMDCLLYTSYRIFHDATFPAFHIGNRLLVRRNELLDWLEQQKVNKAQNENPKIVGSDE